MNPENTPSHSQEMDDSDLSDALEMSDSDSEDTDTGKYAGKIRRAIDKRKSKSAPTKCFLL